MPKARQNPETFQAIVAAPGFCLGIRCDDAQIHRIDFLAAGAETSPSNPLAMNAAQQLQAFLSDAEFTFNLPIDQKIKNGWTRYVYRNAMKGRMPELNRLRRSKIGFTNPETPWLKHNAPDGRA